MGKGVGGKKKFPEGAIRINYLHQARHDVLRDVGGECLYHVLGLQIICFVAQLTIDEIVV